MGNIFFKVSTSLPRLIIYVKIRWATAAAPAGSPSREGCILLN
jgi:hypothetical protein